MQATMARRICIGCLLGCTPYIESVACRRWEDSMTELSIRAALSVGLLSSLGVACARRNAPPPPTAAPSSMVTSEDLDRQPGQPIEQVLMGRFPGVMVERTTNGGIVVRIRGTTSIR